LLGTNLTVRHHKRWDRQGRHHQTRHRQRHPDNSVSQPLVDSSIERSESQPFILLAAAYPKRSRSPAPAIAGALLRSYIVRRTLRDAELNAKVALSLVVLLAFARPLLAREPVDAGEGVVLTKASPACAKREDFDRLIELAQRRDAVGFAG
jgi:hypothetical protein